MRRYCRSSSRYGLSRLATRQLFNPPIPNAASGNHFCGGRFTLHGCCATQPSLCQAMPFGVVRRTAHPVTVVSELAKVLCDHGAHSGFPPPARRVQCHEPDELRGVPVKLVQRVLLSATNFTRWIVRLAGRGRISRARRCRPAPRPENARSGLSETSPKRRRSLSNTVRKTLAGGT
jgi:hypothetical protein